MGSGGNGAGAGGTAVDPLDGVQTGRADTKEQDDAAEASSVWRDTGYLLALMAVLVAVLEKGRSQPFPDHVGLLYGLLSVAVGQVVVLTWYCLASAGLLGKQFPIQPRPQGTDDSKPIIPQGETLRSNIVKHLSNPEGFVLIGGYLIITWMYRLMPSTYYDREGPVSWPKVYLSLCCMDFLQYVAHRMEHKISPEFYKKSHKPHHFFTSPKLTDAFDGSLADTTCMIVGPLISTAWIVPVNMWTYAAFGASYSMLLVLIHSEVTHPWDPVFRMLGIGTSGDHHVHHKMFIYNFGHIFTYWDRLAGTYRSPFDVKSFALNQRRLAQQQS